MKFSIKDFFSKCEQVRIFCAVGIAIQNLQNLILWGPPFHYVLFFRKENNKKHNIYCYSLYNKIVCPN